MEMNNCDNVCILLGSPDANGNTAAMCKNAAVFLDNMKIKYQIYNLYEEEIDYILLEIAKIRCCYYRYAYTFFLL